MNTTTASKRTRTTRPREIPAQVPASTRPSERVLQRLLLLCRAEGLEIRTAEEEQHLPFDSAPGVSFTPDTPPHEQAIDIAWSLGFQKMRTASWFSATVQDEQNEVRVDRFTATLLANLYAAEALALPAD